MKRKEIIADIKGLTAEDLQSRARSTAEELMKLRFRKASGQLEQSHRIPELKKNLARVQSFISARAIAARPSSK